MNLGPCAFPSCSPPHPFMFPGAHSALSHAVWEGHTCPSPFCWHLHFLYAQALKAACLAYTGAPTSGVH